MSVDELSADFSRVKLTGNGTHAMKMFGISYRWDDKNGVDEHVTQSLVLPSGTDVGDGRVVEVRVGEDKDETEITVDMSDSLMYHPSKYQAEFLKYHPRVYNLDHDKMKAWNASIAETKGDSEANAIKYIHKEPTLGLSVEKDPLAEKGVDPVRVFMVGKKSNPEGMAHIELTGDKPFFNVVSGDDAMPEPFFVPNP